MCLGVVGDEGSKQQSISTATDLWGGIMILNHYVPCPRCPARDSSIDLIENLGVTGDGGDVSGCGGGEGSTLIFFTTRHLSSGFYSAHTTTINGGVIGVGLINLLLAWLSRSGD
jgi:hypothetical protein